MIGDNEKVNIQGVSYDTKSKHIYYTDSIYIYEMDVSSRVVLKKIDLGFYKRFSPNGILYDNRDKTLWVLCAYSLLLHINDNEDVMSAFFINYIGQDHLCFDSEYNICISTGNDYSGEDNYMLIFNPSLRKVIAQYRLRESYAIEGIYVDNNKLYVVNDGRYHEAKIKESYINIYRIN